MAGVARYRYRLEDLPQQLQAHIKVNLVTGCWEWTSRLDDDGYGQVKWQGVVSRTHRVVYTLLVGPIPDERPDLDHVQDRGCQSRACCWPGHLEPVTTGENSRRPGVAPRTPRTSAGPSNGAKTKCRNGHDYTPENTRIYVRLAAGRRVTERQCRACARDWQRERRAQAGAT